MKYAILTLGISLTVVALLIVYLKIINKCYEFDIRKLIEFYDSDIAAALGIVFIIAIIGIAVGFIWFLITLAMLL